MVLFIGEGQGGFAWESTLAVGPDPGSVVTADFTGNGVPDYAVTRPNTSLISVVTSNANGTPVTNHQISVAGSRYLIVAEDFTGDGAPDIALSGGAAPTQILVNLGGGTFSPGASFGTGAISDLCTMDVDLDGDMDLIEARNLGSSTNQSWLNDGGGTFLAGPIGSGGSRLLSANVNGDMVPDLIQGDAAGDELIVSSGDGAGGFTTTGTLPESHLVSLSDVADVNGDGFPDVLANGYDGWTVHYGRGAAGFAPGPLFFNNSFLGPAVTSGDFDRDGFTDIAWGLSNRVRIGYGDGTRAWPPTRRVSIPMAAQVEILKSGDLDGALDLVASGGLTSVVGTFRGRSSGQFDSLELFKVGTPVGAATPVNLDDDGITDLVTIRDSSNRVNITWGTCR